MRASVAAVIGTDVSAVGLGHSTTDAMNAGDTHYVASAGVPALDVGFALDIMAQPGLRWRRPWSPSPSW